MMASTARGAVGAGTTVTQSSNGAVSSSKPSSTSISSSTMGEKSKSTAVHSPLPNAVGSNHMNVVVGGGNGSNHSFNRAIVTGINPKITSSIICIENHNICNSSCSHNNSGGCETDTESEISSISDLFYHPYQISQPPQLRVRAWDKKQLYSDFIRNALIATRQGTKIVNNVVMLFESPSCSTHETSFFNGQTFKFYDYPPSPPVYKSVLAPCRYSMMNGNVYPSYLLDGSPPNGLVEHWRDVIPGFVPPTFVSSEMDMKTSIVYAYLPVEHIPHHVNNPHVHYHVSGKDILHLMTRRTPKLLTNTRDRRPCICKATHSVGNKGIFIIRNDDDERRFESILAETGNPTFVVTEYIEAAQSLSCHFFIHPNSNEVTWFGSNVNPLPSSHKQKSNVVGGVDSSSTTTKKVLKDGAGGPTTSFLSNDTIIVMKDQERMKKLQLPFVQDVVKYFQARDFWGFCGIDVLFDKSGNGYLVDVNPRVTGSSPAIMVALLLYETAGFEYCIFRRGCRYAYSGTAEQFMTDVREFNQEHVNELLIVVTGFVEIDYDSVLQTTLPATTLVQLAVYGKKSLEECEAVLNSFSQTLVKTTT